MENAWAVAGEPEKPKWPCLQTFASAYSHPDFSIIVI